MEHNPESDLNNKTSSEHLTPVTAMNELIQWCVLNAFNIEGQDGVKYVAIDYEEMKSQLDYFIEKEKDQIVIAFTNGQIDIAETFYDEMRERGFGHDFKITENDNEDGEQYFTETFIKQ